MHGRHAARSWGFSAVPVHKVSVAQRKRHDTDTRLGNEVQCPCYIVRRLDRKRTAMTHKHGALKVVSLYGPRNGTKTVGLGIEVFIGMKIER